MLQPYLVKHAIDADIAQKDLVGLAHTGILLGAVLLASYAFQVLSG